jgi:hypothetical protein
MQAELIEGQVLSFSFKVNHPLAAEDFIGSLNRFVLGECRPVDDYAAMQGTLENTKKNERPWVLPHRAGQRK